MKKKIIGFFILSVVAVSTFAGCGSTDKAAAYDEDFASTEEAVADVASESLYETDGFDYYDEALTLEDNFEASDTVKASADETAEVSIDTDDDSSVGDSAVSTRKIVYTADLTIHTKEYDKDINSIRSLVKTTGGYFESTNMSGTKDMHDRNASFTVRVPVDNYTKFMDSVGGVGNVTERNESADDITSSYVDVRARLKSLKNKKARLEEFEAKATKLDDILEFENQINDVQYEIERYTATLNTYKDITSNCTINISVYEVKEYVEPPKDEEPTFLDRISETFAQSIGALLTIVEGIVIVIIFLLPFAIIAAIILIIVVKIRKKLPKKERKAKTYNGPGYSVEQKTVAEEKTAENTEE